ncbi:MAG: LysR family transcriptional regulator [Pelagimonas sp.]|uniref:LysR family transcriptional regulator n=1 Tax=Pelagimonas sp. TaxID=2073170 RepID=UPI003D6BEB6E
MDKQISWNDLKFLVELDTFGGLKRAADQLGYSHQTVARWMKSLEKELGVRMTDTSGQRWTLTQKGKDVLVVVQQMEQRANKVLRVSNNETEAYSCRVGISSVSWGLDLIVLPALKEIQSKYPDLSFDLITQDEVCSIEAGDVDLALRFTQASPQDLIGNKIGPVPLGLYGTAAKAELFKKTRYADVTFIQMLPPGFNMIDGPLWKMPLSALCS